jgi:hypothetical protein
MAKLRITECAGIGLPMQVWADVVAAQAITIGAESTPSQVFSDRTCLLRVFAEEDCTFSVGENPVATETNHFALAAGQYDAVTVQPGWKIAVIARAVS